MAKISALTDGAPAVGTDVLPVARAGANRRLTVANLFASPTITGVATYDLGSAAATTIRPTGGAAGDGIYWTTATNLSVAVGGTERFRLGSGGLFTSSGGYSQGSTIASADVSMIRGGASQWVFGSGTSSAGGATTRSEGNKAVASISNAVATDILTVTIPNAAHSASLKVKVIGSLGSGGAIGANEATATNTYDIVITRTAGVATVAAISSAYGAAASAVAGAATVTATAAITAMSGAVGATQTFTVQVTISRSGGSSTNHTCLVYYELMNANASGLTVA